MMGDSNSGCEMLPIVRHMSDVSASFANLPRQTDMTLTPFWSYFRFLSCSQQPERFRRSLYTNESKPKRQRPNFQQRNPTPSGFIPVMIPPTGPLSCITFERAGIQSTVPLSQSPCRNNCRNRLTCRIFYGMGIVSIDIENNRTPLECSSSPCHGSCVRQLNSV